MKSCACLNSRRHNEHPERAGRRSRRESKGTRKKTRTRDEVVDGSEAESWGDGETRVRACGCMRKCACEGVRGV